jgi:hypothetical protein
MDEELFLTDGQFQRLLRSTDQPDRYSPEICSLVAALHKAERQKGNRWKVRLSEEDIALALRYFETRMREYKTPADTTAWRTFTRESAIAQRLFDEQQAGLRDVPRETLEPGDG